MWSSRLLDWRDEETELKCHMPRVSAVYFWPDNSRPIHLEWSLHFVWAVALNWGGYCRKWLTTACEQVLVPGVDQRRVRRRSSSHSVCGSNVVWVWSMRDNLFYRTSRDCILTNSNQLPQFDVRLKTEHKYKSRNVADVVECRVICNLDQVANRLCCAQNNSLSYPQPDGKWENEKYEKLRTAVVCLLAAPRVQLFAGAGNRQLHNAPRYH